MNLVIQSAFGFFVLHAIAWGLSERRHAVPWHTVLRGMALTAILAVLCLKIPAVKEIFFALNGVVNALERATEAGTAFVFGYLGGGPLPFETRQPGSLFIFAFRALPLILVVSALSSLLFHWGVLQRLVGAFSWLLERVLGIGGAVGLAAAANVFVGMVEAPIFVRPYIARMSRGELFNLMTCGMATIAGTVMVLYASVLGPVIPDAIGHILIASIISTPAAITVAALMVPPEGTQVAAKLSARSPASGSMDAITRGTSDGVQLLINVLAMLVVLVALVSLANQLLGLLPKFHDAAWSLQRVVGWIGMPLAWLLGIPWQEAQAAGALLGTKVILNEFIAYLELASLPQQTLSERSQLLMTYALCGFANLGSLGIMIGGITAMAPERRQDIVELGTRTLVSGTLATCIAAAIVGVLS